MKKTFKRIIAGICLLSILMGAISPVLAMAIESISSEGKLIEANELPLRLYYDEEAPYFNENIEVSSNRNALDGWERWSIPIGNGYFGANVFGRTETERIQITEKTLSNPYYKTNPNGQSFSLGGLNNFSETYIDIGHPFASVTNYERWLDLNTAIAGTKYDYEGVTYSREVFTSYPDKVLVIRLDASETGKIDFTLRPTIPWEQEYAAWEGDTASKEGQVTSYIDGNDGVIELSGKMGYYDIDFLGIYRVVTDGGQVSATTVVNADGDTDGTITVTGANSAYIYVVLGTDYELTEEMFTSSDKEKPTFSTNMEYTKDKIGAEADAIAAKISGKSYEEAYAILKNAHIKDYSELFGRVTLNLGDEADAALTTDALLEKRKSGEYSGYLDTLYFQYGRYLLIACSRPGSLPANLQGVWNRYNTTMCGCGFWHNINVQMNYWPAFSTNIAETFEAYIAFNQAYMKAAEQRATDMVSIYYPDQLGMDGGNGFCVGTGALPYSVGSDRSTGNLGFTTQLYWDYYQYTQDKTILENIVFPVLVNAAKFIVKVVELTEDGHYLVSYCDSPEMHVNGVWYYTKGTTYAQTFAYLNNYNALLAAKELGIDLSDSEVISSEDLCVFERLMEQIDKYDPIHVGLSGQVKEFREEDYYCSIGDNPHHRHVSQLVGLYPGNLINDTTPAWLDAAKVTLEARGEQVEDCAWALSHRMALWARAKDGDRAYKVFNDLLTQYTLTNLWSEAYQFQIDGNLGATAGISEMLLQSHAGYIAPLASLPAAWDSGSYTGLVAIGNFEVAAEWKNGMATCFNITSKAGGDASVFYGGITSAKVVRASDGKAVNYTVTGTDLITFATEPGETYIISGFKLTEKLPAPTSFTTRRMGGEYVLEWTEVEGAVGYNVYTAIENQADYTLLGFTTKTGAIYVPTTENENARTTFKVVPVSEDGTEGVGAIAYKNPIDVNALVTDYEANAFENGELQVTIKATDNTLTYKLWRMAEGEDEYTLITESPYPIIIYDEYNETDRYAVSVVSKYLRAESELYVLPTVRKVLKESVGDDAKWYTNLLLNQSAEPFDSNATKQVYSGYGYTKLTDGNYGTNESGAQDISMGRFSTITTAGAYMDAVITLESECLLSELRMYDFRASGGPTMGDVIRVYAYSEDNWVEVYSIVGAETITASLKDDSSTNSTYLPMDLGGVKTNKVRIYAENSASNGYVTLYEITCSGEKLASRPSYSENILSGKTIVANDEATPVLSSVYGYSKLTDNIYKRDENGVMNVNLGRYSSCAQELPCLDGTVDLGGIYMLSELRIYDFSAANANTIGDEVIIYARLNGAWRVVATIMGDAAVRESKKLDNEPYVYYLPIDLSGVTADAIRIHTKDTLTTNGITIYEITCSGVKLSDKINDENILVGKEMVPNEEATPIYSDTYGYPKLTDGIYKRDANGVINYSLGRYSSRAQENACLDGTVELGGVYLLSELLIFDYGSDINSNMIGNEVIIYARLNGEWRTVATVMGDDVTTLRKLDDKLWIRYLPIDLSGVAADAIRIHTKDTLTTNGISIYEITCTGVKIEDYCYDIFTSNVIATTKTSSTDSNILAGKTFTADADATAMIYSPTYSYAKLTDGIYDKDSNGNRNIALGRYSTKSLLGAYVDGTVELGDVYILDELRMYDFLKGGDSHLGFEITVYARSGGVWHAVSSISGHSNIISARKYDAEKDLYYLPIDMSGIKADAIRVYSSNNYDAGGISIYEITCSGIKLLTDAEFDVLTDGNADTVYSPADNVSSYTLEFDLGQNYKLHHLNIREAKGLDDQVNGEQATRSNDTIVELYMNGLWTRIVYGISLNTVDEYTVIQLYGLTASKIRIVFNNTQTFDNDTCPGVKISELSLYVYGEAVDKNPLLEAYSALPIIINGGAEYDANKQRFYEYATEFMPSTYDVAAYIEEMIAYNATLLDGTHSAHNIVTHEAKTPTCNDKGYYAYEECTLCDYTTYEIIFPVDHAPSEEWEIDENGHYKTCGNGCGEKLDYAEHIYTDVYDTECNVCGFTRTIAYGFVSTYLNLASDLNMVYRVLLPDSSDATVTFCIDGYKVSVESFGTDENGLHLFRLAGITPAKMNKSIQATLIVDGEEFATCNSITIKSYLDSVKETYKDNEQMVALVDSLLVYGAAAQQYVDKNTDGFDEDTLTKLAGLTAIPTDANAGEKTGVGVEYFGMNLTGAFSLRVGILLENVEGVTLEVGDKVYNVADYTAVEGIRVITCGAFSATELDEDVTFTLRRGDEVLGTLTVDANAYLYRASNSTEENLAPLAKAIYAYGVAAEAYSK